MTRTRSLALAVGVLCTVTLGGVVPGRVAAASTAGCPPRAGESPPYTPDDVNGDATSDLVVGVPDAVITGHRDAGAVDIHYRDTARGGPSRRIDETSFRGLDAVGTGDRFGTAVAFAHVAEVSAFNAFSSCADLVVGAPGARAGRGAVVVALGTHTGVSRTGARRLVGRTPGERFGSSVAAYGQDVWIGAPMRTVAGHRAAGAVDHFRVTATSVRLIESITEDTPDVPGVAEADDHFGAVLDMDSAGHVVVGEPDEDVGSATDAGSVTVLYTRANGRFVRAAVLTQNTPGVSGAAERGDRFGAAVSIGSDSQGASGDSVLAVGVPGEGLGSVAGAGLVQRFRVSGRSAPVQIGRALTQESPGIAGTSEAGDGFGSAVAVVDGGNDVQIGVPGEDLNGVPDAGAVVDEFGRYLHEGGARGHTVGGTRPHAGARVGAALSRLAVDDEGDTHAGGDGLVVAVPGYGVSSAPRAGAVALVPTDVRPTLVLDSSGAVSGERYGAPAGAVGNGPALS